MPLPASSVAKWQETAESARSYLASAEALKMLEVWASCGRGDQLPEREDLKPETFPALLPDIWLMDYLPETRQLRYRLEGENIRARHDRSLVGQCLEDIVAPDALEKVRHYFLACVEAPAITMVVGRLYHEWRRPGYGERLLLPLFSAAGKAEGLIGITVCKQTFANRALAEERSKRITCILPLDGSKPEEQSE